MTGPIETLSTERHENGDHEWINHNLIFRGRQFEVSTWVRPDHSCNVQFMDLDGDQDRGVTVRLICEPTDSAVMRALMTISRMLDTMLLPDYSATAEEMTAEQLRAGQ